MEKIGIEYKGIVRSISSQQIIDGSLDELINYRHRNGRLQPVGHPTKLYELPSGTFTKIWLHDQDGIQNYIGLDTSNALKLIDMELGTSVLIKQYSSSVEIEFLKRFLIVNTGAVMDIFIFGDDNTYEPVEISQEPLYYVNTANEEKTSSYDEELHEQVATANGLLGQYFKRLTEKSNQNRFTGGIFFRAAYKLYDGSYIFHTLPKFLSVEDLTMDIHKTDTGVETALQLSFYTANAEILIKKDDYLNFDSDVLQDIINSIVIFACKFETIVDISEDTINFESLEEWMPNDDGFVELNSVLPVNPDFKDMIKSPSWYKVGEYDFSELLDGNDIEETIDLDDFYHDYAVRETMPVNDFTQHKLTANDIYNYNSRLVLTNTVQILFEKLSQPVYKFVDDNFEIIQSFKFFDLTVPGSVDFTKKEYDADIVLVFTLKTSSGTKKVVVEQTVPLYSTVDASNKALAFSIIGYPDQRAKSVEIYHVNDVNSFSLIKTLKLTSNPALNYSYYNNKKFSAPEIEYDDYNFAGTFIEFDLSTITPVEVLPVEDKIIYDANRVQMSELSNPFYFPAENSYQVGTGEGIASRANTEPLSTGQFGEYPLIVFTSKGIWTLLQGQGDVLFSSIKPLNGEVPLSKEQITPIGTGVVYTTKRGLYLVSGRSVQELSKALYGRPNLDIQSVDNFKLRVNHTSLVQLPNSLSTVNAKTYMVDAKVGFSKQNNELLATNSDYSYSYVYNFDSGYWHKISESFGVLINAYPDLQAVQSGGSNDDVFNLSNENFDTAVQTIIVSRPCKIDNQVDFVLIHRAIQRCEIETPNSVFAGFYVFGSNDLKVWQLFQGSDKKTGEVTDIFCTRAHIKAKYFVFVFAADLKEDSVINNLELQYYHKLMNKVR